MMKNKVKRKELQIADETQQLACEQKNRLLQYNIWRKGNRSKHVDDAPCEV
jgi:hypothetical protein